MAQTQEVICKCGCKQKFAARTADIKRGWGVYKDKSHKARAQEKANGLLIAAAPELLEALRTLTFECEKRAGAPKRFIEAAYAIIKKAEGKICP